LDAVDKTFDPFTELMLQSVKTFDPFTELMLQSVLATAPHFALLIRADRKDWWYHPPGYPSHIRKGSVDYLH